MHIKCIFFLSPTFDPIHSGVANRVLLILHHIGGSQQVMVHTSSPQSLYSSLSCSGGYLFAIFHLMC